MKDENTGEVSAPFAIGNNKYQMIRGIHPSGEVGLAVFCHDETDEAGENIIYPMDYFEENIAKPMMEKETMTEEYKAHWNALRRAFYKQPVPLSDLQLQNRLEN